MHDSTPRLAMSGTRQQPPVDPEVGLLDVEEAVGPKVVLDGEGRDEGPYAAGTFRKIGAGMVTLVVLVLATYVVPGLHRAQPWTSDDPALFWNLIGREFIGESAQEVAADERADVAEQIAHELAAEEDDTPLQDAPVIKPPASDRLPPYKPHPDDAADVPQELELPTPTTLDDFYAQLARTEARYEGAITRVSMWGDSVVGNDHVTSALRTEMQRRFGDSGHGFHLLRRGTPSYRHVGIRFSGGDNWRKCFIINDCRKDGHYGFGGTTVWSAGGATSKFATARKTPNGRKVSRFEVWYAGQKRGGKIRVKVDDEEPAFIETDAAEYEDRWHTINVTDGPHTFEVRASGGGQVRLYGVVLERDVPGVVWDGMSQVGAFTSRFLYFDDEHIKGQVEHRDPRLIVFMFGGNDRLIRASRMDRYKRGFGRVLKKFRAQNKPPACLIVSPVDHGRRKGGRIEGDPRVTVIAKAQREVAVEQGCAFFDTQAAMGGEGSVAKWRRRNPPLISGDLAHPTEAGQRVLGHMIYLALMKGYREYRARTDSP